MVLYFLFAVVFLPNISLGFKFDSKNVVYAINAGDVDHTDIWGIKYERDYSTVGQTSNYGELIDVKRVHKHDVNLYQVERYYNGTFEYKLPVLSDGEYVLVLKFCEVYFEGPNFKVFDVTLNGILILNDFDIFAKAGKGVAHDEHISFYIINNTIRIGAQIKPVYLKQLELGFHVGRKDNPKLNAFFLFKGSEDDLPMYSDVPEGEIMDKSVEVVQIIAETLNMTKKEGKIDKFISLATLTNSMSFKRRKDNFNGQYAIILFIFFLAVYMVC